MGFAKKEKTLQDKKLCCQRSCSHQFTVFLLKGQKAAQSNVLCAQAREQALTEGRQGGDTDLPETFQTGDLTIG